jgi:protein-arginine kinase activator protein McsA
MLYDFSELKLFVQRLGIDPDSINSTFKPITQTLTKAELDKNVEFDLDGIFFVDKKGNKHKGFLYIEAGYSRATAARNGWKTIIPKFHVLNCATIQEKKNKKDFNGKYVFSNQVIEMEDIDGTKRELEICENCVKSHTTAYSRMKTSNYKEEVILNGEEEGNFSDNELPKEVTTDFWGYTPDWDATSKNYRMKNKFTCESCGISLNQNMADGYFLETHHLDGNKKNNDDDNLKCLCVLCHANFDDTHRVNFSRGQGKQKLVDFIKLFEDKLRQIGNPYLGNYRR